MRVDPTKTERAFLLLLFFVLLAIVAGGIVSN
jgi:hypothetical protein